MNNAEEGRRPALYEADGWPFATHTIFHAGCLLGLFFDPEDEGDMFLRNVNLLYKELRGVMSQMIELFTDSCYYFVF
jgi:hypothetical protein